MSVQIRRPSETFDLLGDGVAMEAQVSIHSYPFLNMPDLQPSGIELGSDGGGKIVSVSLQGSDAVFVFDHAFSGPSGSVSAYLTFNLPA